MSDQRPNLDGIVSHYAELFGLTGWTITSVWMAADQMPIKGSLACCRPTPTRRIARLMVSTECPAEELRPSIAHELVHVLLSPLVETVEQSSGAVMLEEQIVEALCLAMTRAERSPVDARVMARAVKDLPVRVRARLSALSTRARIGGQMDPEMVKKLLDAIEANDAEAMKECCKALIAAAASGGGAAEVPETEPALEPDGDEGAAMDEMPARDDETADPAEEPKPEDEMGRVAARKGAPRPAARKGATKVNEPKVDTETLRARKVAKDSADELAAMAKAQRPMAIETLVVGLRARLGDRFTPAAEKKIMAAGSFQKAQELASFAESMGGEGSERARSGADPKTNPGGGPKLVAIEELIAEGHGLSWINGYQSTAKKDPSAGVAYLETGREMLRARKAANGANGAGRAS